ncbi:conjugal transfer protein TraN [Ralstonia pseudosolanacearum]|uniref:conjugal transfer protein TraN n=1 Tax=Ralstonia pseudosolanacearum TaxID=1310165 RepID=UPI003CF92602
MKTLIKVIVSLTLAFLALISGPAQANLVCKYTQTDTCIDSADRWINGVQVHRACWTYQAQFLCSQDAPVNYCSAIQNIAGCYQTGSTCVETAVDGTCARYTNTYRCGDGNLGPVTNTVKLDNTYTIVTDKLDTTQCSSYSSNPLCSLASHTCVEPAETRVINGLPVYKSCWKYEDHYTCIDPTPQNDCQQYIDKGCTKTGETCVSTADPIGCVMKDITYSCVIKKGTTTSVEDCSAKTACFQGSCWNTSSPPDGDFAKVVAGMEAAREAGVYGANSMDLFKGEAEQCRKGYGGLKNCCKEDPSAKSNNQVMSTAAMQAVKFGSKYVFDYAYSNSEFIQAGMNALGFDGIDIASNFGSTFSLYGISYTTGAGALAAGETATGAMGQTVYGLGGGFAFDPTSLAIMIAIQVIMELQSCEPEEQQLGMHLGQNLCHYVGSYCSKRILSACVQTSQSYCCYNSKLARIINEQGKPQIGKGWGTPENADCDGFSPDEFQKIDFSKIDMSEFVGDIMNAVDMPNISEIQQKMSNNLNNITVNPPITPPTH